MTSVVALVSQKWGVEGDWPLGIGVRVTRNTEPMLRVDHLAIFGHIESLRLASPEPFQSWETASTTVVLRPYGTRLQKGPHPKWLVDKKLNDLLVREARNLGGLNAPD